MSSKSKQIKNIYDPTEKKSGKQMNDYLLWLIHETNRKLDERLTYMFNFFQKSEKKEFKKILDALMDEAQGGSDVGMGSFIEGSDDDN